MMLQGNARKVHVMHIKVVIERDIQMEESWSDVTCDLLDLTLDSISIFSQTNQAYNFPTRINARGGLEAGLVSMTCLSLQFVSFLEHISAP